MVARSISSLFVMHLGSNAGYAISPLETLFFEAGLDLACSDPDRVHFAYRSLDRGRPQSLPASFNNLTTFDYADTRVENIKRLTAYIRKRDIRLVLIFDIQPLHPLFRSLRQAGATTLLAYYGAPVSSLMPPWKLALKRLQVRFSLSKVDGLIFESHAMADRAIYGRGVPKDMINVVPVGVDIRRFQPEHTDYAHRVLSIPPGRRIVIYAGHMERRKGVHILVQAAIELLHRRKRSDICFAICGNTEDQSKEFEAMYNGLGIHEWIRFLGYRSDLPELYTGSFCGIIPSTGWDSFPRSSIEMAAAGLPVVASRLDGLPEAVLHNTTGLLFEPGNVDALADSLALLLDRPDVAEQLGQRGRARCEQELNLRVQRERFCEVLRRYVAP